MSKTIINESRPESQPLETAWHSRLCPEKDALYLSGYRAYCADGSLFVRKPDGTRYLVNPAEDTCTCRAGQLGRLCKHRRSIVSLVFLSMSELAYRGKTDAYTALCDYWYGYCVSLGGEK